MTYQNIGQPPNAPFTEGTQDGPSNIPTVITSEGLTIGDISAQPAVGRLFTEEEVARIRQEEKDKLYGRLSTAEDRFKTVEQQLAEMNAARQAELDAAKKADEARLEAERKAAEEEMTAKQLIETREAEWNNRFAQLQAERDQERIVLQKEREYNELRAYIAQRAREETENIAPELLDLIDGSSREEVEARIGQLRVKSEQIAASVQQAQQAQRSQMRGVSTAGYAATGPLENEMGQRQLTEDEIRNMPMSEWAKIRGKLIGGNQQTNQGLYG